MNCDLPVIVATMKFVVAKFNYHSGGMHYNFSDKKIPDRIIQH